MFAALLRRILGIGNTDNFELIAMLTTRIYLELKRSHKDAFVTPAMLLATAGTIDSITYIFDEKSIEIEKLIELAEKAVDKSNSEIDRLADFVTDLEIQLFRADFIGKIDTTEIIQNCYSQKNKIRSVIEKELYADEKNENAMRLVRAFMYAEMYQGARKQLKILD